MNIFLQRQLVVRDMMELDGRQVLVSACILVQERAYTLELGLACMLELGLACMLELGLACRLELGQVCMPWQLVCMLEHRDIELHHYMRHRQRIHHIHLRSM